MTEPIELIVGEGNQYILDSDNEIDLSFDETIDNQYELANEDEQDLDVDLDMKVEVDSSRHENYKGAYVVNPSFNEQELSTKNKLMADNVVVKQIMVSITSNPSGGNTAYIGG